MAVGLALRKVRDINVIDPPRISQGLLGELPEAGPQDDADLGLTFVQPGSEEPERLSQAGTDLVQFFVFRHCVFSY